MSTRDDHQQRRRRKRRPSSRSLLPFLRAVVGSPVVVELTNDDVIRGTLDSVDDGMNLVLSGSGSEGVRWTRKGTSEPRPVLGGGATLEPSSFAPSLHVRGRRIRFVHLPPTIDPSTVVDADRDARESERRAFRRELLTRAHAGGDAAERRRKGMDAEGGEGGRSSETGSDDEGDGREYYYEDFDDGEGEGEDGEQREGDDDGNE